MWRPSFESISIFTGSLYTAGSGPKDGRSCPAEDCGNGKKGSLLLLSLLVQVLVYSNILTTSNRIIRVQFPFDPCLVRYYAELSLSINNYLGSHKYKALSLLLTNACLS